MRMSQTVTFVLCLTVIARGRCKRGHGCGSSVLLLFEVRARSKEEQLYFSPSSLSVVKKVCCKLMLLKKAAMTLPLGRKTTKLITSTLLVGTIFTILSYFTLNVCVHKNTIFTISLYMHSLPIYVSKPHMKEWRANNWMLFTGGGGGGGGGGFQIA